MANTRKSTKRAEQARTRQTRNTTIRSATRSAVKGVIEALKTKDAAKVKEAYAQAVKSLSKAATKGAIPKGRAARKVSRLTLFLKKNLPAAVGSGTKR
ncbi:MAG: 30S ribosomal protein S20 [Oligoflexia bacterium]|jgi:small subunit ribosomal protein S20